MSNAHYFKGKAWAVTGALDGMSRSDAHKALEARGARVVTSVSSKTDYLVSADYDPSEAVNFSRKELEARKHSIPIFNDAQLQALLAGEALEVVEELAPEVAPIEEVGSRDALEAFRDLLYDEPNPSTWEQLCALVDQCSAADLPIVVDYLEGNLAAWPEAPETWGNYARRHEMLRRLPPEWRQDVFHGVNSPKLRLIRAVDLQNAKMNGKIGAQMLECTHLESASLLDLRGNKLPGKFFKALGTSDTFRKLTHLFLGDNTWTDAQARGFNIEGSVLAGVRFVDLSNAAFKGEALQSLLEAPCWSGLESLVSTRLWSEGPDIASALLEASHMGSLSELRLGWPDELDQEALASLLADPTRAAGLRVLSLGVEVNSHALDTIAKSAHLSGLEVLHLPRAERSAALGSLLSGGRLANTRELVIPLPPEGIETLTLNPALRPRELYLRLHGAELGRAAAESLLSSALFANLESLKIESTGDETLLADILRRPEAASLHTLSAGIFDADAALALLEGVHLGKLQTLWGAAFEKISRRTVEAIEHASHLQPKLRETLVGHLRRQGLVK